MKRFMRIGALALAAGIFAAALAFAADGASSPSSKPSCECGPKVVAPAQAAQPSQGDVPSRGKAYGEAQKKVDEANEKIEKALSSDATTLGQLKALRGERRKALSELRAAAVEEGDDMADFLVEVFRERSKKRGGMERRASFGCESRDPRECLGGPGCADLRPGCGPGAKNCGAPCSNELQRPAKGDCGPCR